MSNKIIRKLSLVSIVGNTLLFVFKFFAGVFGKSGAMISDAVHSFSDVLTTIIAYFGVKISKKEADKDHPYGHERLECVASIILGFMLMATGFSIGLVGTKKIFSGNYDSLEVPTLLALSGAVVSIIAKETMYWYTRYYAKKINSSVYLADAWHHRSDAFSSIGSLIGIAGAMLGFPVLDPVASVIICLFIFKVAYDIIKDSLEKMTDTSCDDEYEAKLLSFIENNEEIIKVDMLQTRMFGNRVYIDLEISVDGNKTLFETHEISHKIHDEVEKTFPEIKHIMIHLNPGTVL